MTNLDELLLRGFEQFRIASNEKVAIEELLGRIKLHDEATYEHCVRVGLLCGKIGEYLADVNYNPTILFSAGLLHDIGKLKTPIEVLRKNQGFNEEDMQEIRKHPKDGYLILQDRDGINPIVPHIVVRHHYQQDDAYPEILPPIDEVNILDIWHYVKVVSVSDYYDALGRNNDRFGGKPLSSEDKKTIMNERWGLAGTIRHKSIMQLYSAGIFS